MKQRARHGTGGTARPAYGDLTASALYCARCRRAVPVRSRLLLVLPEGELHEYLCEYCLDSLGTKKVTGIPPGGLIVP